MYNPQPLDTSKVTLSKEINQLVEVLAESVHDLWAKQRLEQGWVYGKERNDELKTHPGLVPYEELSEQEKDYDRATAKSTIMSLYALGYEIKKKEEENISYPFYRPPSSKVTQIEYYNS